MSCESHDVLNRNIVVVLSPECQRLMADDYDSSYPDDDRWYVYLVNDCGNYTYSHKWSSYEHRRYLDSISCGYEVIDYGLIDLLKADVIIDWDTLKCNN